MTSCRSAGGNRAGTARSTGKRRSSSTRRANRSWWAAADGRSGIGVKDSSESSDRINASTLLDANLDAGRAGSVALTTAEGGVTYGELSSLVAGVAVYLRELGVRREQRVLMVMDDSPA